MNKDEAIVVTLVAASAAVVIVSQQVYMNQVARANDKHRIKHAFQARTIEKLTKLISPEQWKEVSDEIAEDITFTEIAMRNV